MLAVKGLVSCCWYVVALHECLGEVLGTLQHGTLLRGSYDGDVLRALVGLQVVVDALYQRVFRTYHHHADLLVYAELLDGFEVVGLHVNVLAALAGAGIARCDV